MQAISKNMILISLLLFTNICNDQTINASLPEPGYLFINKNVEYLATENEISVTDVLKPSSQKGFKKVPDISVLFKGYDAYHYWYRFSISNKDTVNKPLIFLLGQLGIRHAEIWKRDKNTWVSLGKTGYKYPFKSRPHLFAHYAYPISVAPLVTDTFYVNADENHAFKVIAFALLKPKVMNQMEK